MTINKASMALAALATSALLAACGGSSSKPSTSASAGAPNGSRTAVTACLRKHGINLPAGGGPGGGVPGGGVPGAAAPPSGAPGAGSGSSGGSPPAGFPGGGGGKFQAALKACGANFPAGRRPGGFSKQAIQNYVSCVRQHGYNLPSPNLSGKGSVFPAKIRSDPKFQAASRSCQSLLVPPQGSNAAPGA